MRMIVLSVLGLFFCAPAMADTLKCQYEKPNNFDINRAKGMHPTLDYRQIDTVASLLELIDANYLSLLKMNEFSLSLTTGTPGEQPQALLARTEDLAMRILDLQIRTFYTNDKMSTVKKKMDSEKDAGLEEISAGLELDARHFAVDMMSLYLEWSAMRNEVLQLFADRQAAQGVNIDYAKIAKETCILMDPIRDALSDSPDRVPDLLMFAYGERLKY